VITVSRLRVLAFLSLLACGHSSNSAATSDAGADDDAGIPCDGSGVSKGPWVLAASDTTAKIRWESCRAGTAAGVAITPESGGAARHVDAVESSAVVSDTFHALNDYPDYAGTWYMHEAALQGLAGSTCYTYALDADATRGGRLCTTRAPGDKVRFVSIGDTNAELGDNTKNVIAHVLPFKFDFIVHGGDIQYYDSAVETWAGWFPIMQPLLSAGAFLPAIGNHEAEKQVPNELTEYTYRFFGGAGFDGTDGYYRFESGGVWFFAINTEEPLDPQSAQGQWLVTMLADAAKKPGFRFSIVNMHKPFLTCGDTGDNITAQQYFEPIFKQYKVALVLQAHMHGYERFVYNGITYVTSAGGGGLINDPNANVARTYCNTRVASGNFYHAVVFDIDANGMAGNAVDTAGQSRDMFSIAAP
jgi:hypothetical protein